MGKFLLPFKEGRRFDSRFSPTSIFVSSIFMGILLSLQTQLLILLGLIGLVLLFGTLAKTRWRTVMALAARFEIVILFWVLLLPFFYGSSVILSISVPWGQLIAYQEGLEFGILIGFRIFGLITMFLAALSHMSLAEFIGALKTLKIPTSILGSLLIMLRYIPLFVEERQRMQEAQQLRGFKKGEWLGRIRSLGFLVGSTIDRAMDRSISVYESMTLRGFGHGMFVVGARPKRNDVLLILSLILLTLFLFNQQILGVLSG
ncbi:MAG: energy-coupling factor transporter transmembrane component T family protein [Candidatus Thorarchaeota archaeon]